MSYTYCNRTELKPRIDGMERACRFGYCSCYTLYGAVPEVRCCFQCDDFKRTEE